MLKSISAKVWLFSALFVLLLVSQFTLRYIAETRLASELSEISTRQLQVVYHAYTLREATTQVQQWLTDISATRGLDGLNDGFDKAEEYRQVFESTIADLIVLDAENDDVYRALLPLFNSYYETGRKMAQGYVEAGPDKGNQMMASFDSVAEAINEKVDAFLNQQKTVMRESIAKEVVDAEHAVALLLVFLALYISLLVTLLLGNKWAIGKPLSLLTNIVQELASQQKKNNSVDIDTSTLTTDRRTEVGAIGFWLNELLSSLKDQHHRTLHLLSENTRVKQALHNANTNVLMVDVAEKIIYLNDSMQAMLAKAEQDLKKVIPHIDRNNLVGQDASMLFAETEFKNVILTELSQTLNKRIKIGTRTFDVMATPVFGDDSARLGTVFEWEDITEALSKNMKEQQIAEENSRIRQALDTASANVLLVDSAKTVIYANSALLRTLSATAKSFSKDLPAFSSIDLIGVSASGLFAKIVDASVAADGGAATVALGDRTVDVRLNPVRSASGERLGTVIEWYDRTAEVLIERELDQVVTAASQGDFSKGIALDGKDGFFLTLSKGLNLIVDNTRIFVNEMDSLFQAVAAGDLSKEITHSYQGELAKIKDNANASLRQLNATLREVSQCVQAISSSAREVSQGSEDLRQRTESQAASIEETSSSMEQISSVVKQSADNSLSANQLAGEGKSKAEAGGSVVEQAIDAMKDISDASNKINDIIGAIDEIAFQTNLLALNAAVEAARAGEQGRGFAVVASEVRSLSQRSAMAAKQIKELIKDSVSKVQNGAELVNQSGRTLTEIVDSATKIADLIALLTNAASEQSMGVEQIKLAIQQMDQLTQQNAALAEETTSASLVMSDEVKKMNQLIGFFQLGGAPLESLAGPSNFSAIQAKKHASKEITGIATTEPKTASKSVSFDKNKEWDEF